MQAWGTQEYTVHRLDHITNANGILPTRLQETTFPLLKSTTLSVLVRTIMMAHCSPMRSINHGRISHDCTVMLNKIFSEEQIELNKRHI